MFLFGVKKFVLWVLLVLELLCVLLHPTNGHTSLKEDVASDDEDQVEVHPGNVPHEDLDGEEDEEENPEFLMNKEESKDVPCSYDRDESLNFRCTNNVKCCVTEKCRDVGNLERKRCQEIYDSANRYEKIYNEYKSSKGL